MQLVLKNGISEKIKLGDTVEFVTAPRYFGDGYVMPIVAISVEGEQLLDYEEDTPILWNGWKRKIKFDIEVISHEEESDSEHGTNSFRHFFAAILGFLGFGLGLLYLGNWMMEVSEEEVWELPPMVSVAMEREQAR